MKTSVDIIYNQVGHQSVFVVDSFTTTRKDRGRVPFLGGGDRARGREVGLPVGVAFVLSGKGEAFGDERWVPRRSTWDVTPRVDTPSLGRGSSSDSSHGRRDLGGSPPMEKHYMGFYTSPKFCRDDAQNPRLQRLRNVTDLVFFLRLRKYYHNLIVISVTDTTHFSQDHEFQEPTCSRHWSRNGFKTVLPISVVRTDFTDSKDLLLGPTGPRPTLFRLNLSHEVQRRGSGGTQ